MSGFEQAPFLSLAPLAIRPDRIWWTRAHDGVRVRAALWHAPEASGHVVLLSGRTEYLEKTAIPAAQFVQRGLSVVSLDWRGQGLSDRQAEPSLKGHIGDFTEFQHDLDAVLADSDVAGLPGKRLLAGHSMGGAISAAVLMRPDLAPTFSAAILSAPMFGIEMNPAMRMAAWLTAKIGLAIGRADAWPPLGDSASPYVTTEFEGNLLTGDRAVWDWMREMVVQHPEIALGAPTLGWFSAASREMRRLGRAGPAPCPMLCLVGSKEKVVDGAAVKRAAERLGADCVEVHDAAHEAWVERAAVRDVAWSAMDNFLSRHSLLARKVPSSPPESSLFVVCSRRQQCEGLFMNRATAGSNHLTTPPTIAP